MKKLPTREELIAQGYPFGMVTEGIPFGDSAVEWMRTAPDVKVYIPEKDMGPDCDNCVLAVTPTPDGKELLAIWTQSSAECFGDNHIVIARTDDGENWSAPQTVIGARSREEKQSSWGMPMYTRSGRLYIFYIQESDRQDLPGVASGELALMYSDDDGRSWSVPGIAPLPRCRYDHPDPTVSKNWWSFQAPIRDAQGRFIAGFTIESSPAAIGDKRHPYPNTDTRAAFIRFENLDDDPEPQDVQVSILPEDGLEVPNKNYPEVSTAQEAAPVLLPDGRLFATMRTMAGCIYYTVWDGERWCAPRPMRGPDGQPMPHPLGPCPIYRLQDGTYLCLTYNNPGQRLGFDVFAPDAHVQALNVARGPLYLVAGVFDPTGEQPIRFGAPVLFIDTDAVALGKRKQSCTAPLYTAVTQWRGKTMLWYPDRKYQILGKEILPEFLSQLCKDL